MDRTILAGARVMFMRSKVSTRRNFGNQVIGLNPNSLSGLVVPVILVSIALLAIVTAVSTPYMAIATAAYLNMVVGWWNRKRTVVHARQMQIAFGIDLALVLFLEVTRDAIGTALSFKLGFFQQLHILFSTLALVLYFPIFFIGRQLLSHKASPQARTWHIRLGVTAFILRTIGFILMFSLLSKEGENLSGEAHQVSGRTAIQLDRTNSFVPYQSLFVQFQAPGELCPNSAILERAQHKI